MLILIRFAAVLVGGGAGAGLNLPGYSAFGEAGNDTPSPAKKFNCPLKRWM